ncbi:hypothetical protein GCM10009087_03360 [Sphingomonas oligophenolica]|uniref:Glycerophosphoryl diester phosphodiesterase membrane domain-containing protein n=1 Tax=Sphingomonas oligophenolica TaxID=301154 RepID=A0ABU9Y0J4_9SPHN
MTYSETNGAQGGFPIGGVFSRAVGMVGANPGAALALGLVFGAIPLAAYDYLFRGPLLRTVDQPTAIAIAAPLVGLVVGAVHGTLAQGAFLPLAVAQDSGTRMGMGGLLGAGLRATPMLFMLGLIKGILITLGLVALVVPGVMLLLFWVVASAALVDQRTGIFEALGRSRMLTKGARFQILGIVLATTVGFSALNYAAARLTGRALGAGNEILVMRGLVGTITTIISGSVFASLYVELRTWKEGAPTDALAEIFA